MMSAPIPKKEQFFILDGTAYAYRSFFAIQHLSNSQGLPTNAVYGFARALQKILFDYQPEYVAVSFDLAAPTFRHEQYKEYKAHRPGMPPELVTQIPLIRELVEAYNIPVLEMEGFEADDVMGTMACKAKARGVQTVILTGDKDMLQFVDDDIRVMSTSKESLVYGAKEVKEKFGVEPALLTQVLALTGDASDNVPGVPGIGPKTAGALVREYGGVDKIYENIDKIQSPKNRDNLLAHRAQVIANLELIRVRTDVPIAADLPDCRRRLPNKEQLIDFFKRMEFSGLMKALMEPGENAAPDAEAAPILLVENSADLARQMDTVANAQAFIFDLVTSSVHPMAAQILGAVFGVPRQASAAGAGGPHEWQVFYVRLGEKLSSQDFLAVAKNILSDPRIGKIGHDLKYDAVVLLHHGVELRGISFDTMLASYLLNPSRMRHGLGDLALEYLSQRMTTVRDLLGTKGAKASDKPLAITDVAPEELARFACAEARVIAHLREVLMPLVESKQLDKLFHDVEIPLELVLARMEHAGIGIDLEILQNLSKDFENQLQNLTTHIHRLAGGEFNIASPKELGSVLFEKLKLPTHRKTKTGYSTDADVLTSLARTHELPALVLQYRALGKLKSTYSDALPCMVHPETHRIHTSFNQTVTATGRLSSSDPNLQNIPVKTPMGLSIRGAFIPAGGHRVFVAADYSQIELRILAHLSGDEKLMEAFAGDMDVHRQTAGLVFGVPPAEVTDDQRRKAKIVNFGILYGMGAFSLAGDMGVAPHEAQAFIDEYFNRYRGVQEFIQQLLIQVRRDKVVTTLLGRRRAIGEINSANFSLRQFAERTAINTSVQGSAADIIKMAMLEVDKELATYSGKARMLLQIHDELLFEVDQTFAPELSALAREKMENVVTLKVPLKVDVKTGRNWAEL